MARSAAHTSKRAESRLASRVPNSRAVALRANSLFGMMQRFRRLVWAHYRTHGRHNLPWRKDYDPYRVLVSEVMLQQTQVERVIPFYRNFLKKFPTVRALARASLSDVLRNWQGLGYNRRAKMLHQAAKESVMNYGGKFPTNAAELEQFPGIGPYTARAVAAFAFNQDVVVIETNIRTAVIHHFFPKRGEGRVGRTATTRFSPNRKNISDTEIEKILKQVLSKGKAREWYSALMDYGAHLKRSGISHNARSKTYTKQSKFSGSLREARGIILRELAKGTATQTHLSDLFGAVRRLQLRSALVKLASEGLIQKRGKVFTLPR